MSAKDMNMKKKYKLMPPEGGWGYMIIVAVIINLCTMTMFQPSFGLLYNQFMADIHFGTTHMNMMLGVLAMCAAIAGFMTNPLLSIMSIRMLTFIGVLIFNAGVIGNVFVNAIFPFYICTGVLQGTGLGMVYNLSFTILNEYFVKKRLMAISVTQTVIALITMVTPMFLKWSLEEYGYRGTLLLISGITINNLLGVALIQPVGQHMKRIEIKDNEMDILIKHEKEPNEKAMTMTVLKLTDVEGNESKSKEQMHESSIENESNARLQKIIDTLLDKSLRKKFLLSCVSLGPALCTFADMTYAYMLPQALFAAKWDQYYVALALSLIAFGDLVSRIVFSFCSAWMLKLGSEEVYVIGVLIALVARLGSLWSKSLKANLVFITLTGVARCSMVLLLPVVIADSVPPQKFTAAMGMYMLMSGVINLILGPAIGSVRDMTKSYGAAFYLIASCFAMVALFWSIELCYKKNEHKRIQRREYLRQKKLNKG